MRDAFAQMNRAFMALAVTAVSACVVSVPAMATPAAPATERVTKRIEIAPLESAPTHVTRTERAKLRPAVAKTVRDAPAANSQAGPHAGTQAGPLVKMDTVLRCEDGVCVHVSTKTAVSGTVPTDGPSRR